MSLENTSFNPAGDLHLETRTLVATDAVMTDMDAQLNEFVGQLHSAAKKHGEVVGILNSIVIGKEMDISLLNLWNETLAHAYQKAGLSVLGGDTSNGEEFCILATAVVKKADKRKVYGQI